MRISINCHQNFFLCLGCKILHFCWQSHHVYQETLCRGVLGSTAAQLHSTKPELRFCEGSNPARGVSEIRDGEDLLQWFWLELRLNAFRRSTISQKQSIIISSSRPCNEPVSRPFTSIFQIVSFLDNV